MSTTLHNLLPTAGNWRPLRADTTWRPEDAASAATTRTGPRRSTKTSCSSIESFSRRPLLWTIWRHESRQLVSTRPLLKSPHDGLIVDSNTLFLRVPCGSWGLNARACHLSAQISH
jgi:hypothetical protein